MGNKQQLVIIVVVGLEHHKLCQQPKRRTAAKQPALAGAGMAHSWQDEQKHQPDIFYVKPQPRVFQRAVAVAVDPVEVQPQHVGAVQTLGQHRAGHLGQPAHAAHRRQSQPGQQIFGRAGAAGQRVQPARQTEEHQRQRTVGLQKGQRQYQHRQRQPKT